MELLIIRHAQSMHNLGLTTDLDSSLSERGCAQSYMTAGWLRDNFNLDGYQGITSPYLRAIQTATAIKKITGINFQIDGGPREHNLELHCSISIKNRKNEFPHHHWPHEHWNSTAVNYPAETMDDFLLRVRMFMESLGDGKYLIVSHGAPTRTIYTLASGGDLEEVRKRYNDPKGIDSRASIKNASLNWIVNGEEKWFSKVVYNFSSNDDVGFNC